LKEAFAANAEGEHEQHGESKSQRQFLPSKHALSRHNYRLGITVILAERPA
jgi:hypothetical protein